MALAEAVAAIAAFGSVSQAKLGWPTERSQACSRPDGLSAAGVVWRRLREGKPVLFLLP